MALGIVHAQGINLGIGRFTPQQKDAGLVRFAEQDAKNVIRDGFPTLFVVRIGLACTDGQDGIEHQDALLSPTLQATM